MILRDAHESQDALFFDIVVQGDVCCRFLHGYGDRRAEYRAKRTDFFKTNNLGYEHYGTN